MRVHLRRKRFDKPDEIRTVEKARIELVDLGETTIGRTVFEPGWRWSEHVKPIVGTAYWSRTIAFIGHVALHKRIRDAEIVVVGGHVGTGVQT